MDTVIDFLRRTFVLNYRYLLWLQILLGMLIFVIIAPSFDLDLSFVGIKDPVHISRVDLSKTFLKLDANFSLKPAGKFAGHRKYTFSVGSKSKLAEKDIAEIIRILAQRFSYRNEKDLEYDYDLKRKEIYITANSSLDEEYVKKVVASTGEFDVLKYNEEGSDSSIGFLSRENYTSLGIDRTAFRRVTKIALDERLPDDPAARFEIRITLDTDAHNKILSSGTTSYYGVFSGNEFVGFLQNFSSNKYLISGLNSGNDFYANYGRLKSPVLAKELNTKSVEEFSALFGNSTLQILLLQLILVILIVGILLVIVYRYIGLISAVTVFFSALMAIFAIKLAKGSLSEFTFAGLLVAIVISMMSVLYFNTMLRKKDRDVYFLVLIGGIVVLVAYLAQMYIMTIEAMFFIPIIFVVIANIINMLSLNNLLIDKKG